MFTRKINTRKLLAIFVSIYGVLQINSQSNKEIAYAYIKRANDAIEKSIDYSTARINFENAMKYMGTITDEKVASLGARTYFEIHHKQRTVQKQIQFLQKSNTYSKKYFLLAKNKTSDNYAENMQIYNMSKAYLKKLTYAMRKKKMRKF